MKDRDESNKKFSALLSSLSLQDNVGKHTKKEPIEVEFIYREHIEEEWGVADSEHFTLMPKIDPLGNMTPSISQKTFPPMVVHGMCDDL